MDLQIHTKYLVEYIGKNEVNWEEQIEKSIMGKGQKIQQVKLGKIIENEQVNIKTYMLVVLRDRNRY